MSIDKNKIKKVAKVTAMVIAVIFAENSMIFIERDSALSEEENSRCLAMSQDACDTGDDNMALEALRKAVPTCRKPEEVNKEAILDGKHIQDKAYQVNLEQKIAI